VNQRNRIEVTNPVKLLGMLLYTLCGFVLVLVGKLDPLVWVGTAGPLNGVLLGNGVNVRRGTPNVPVLGKKDTT
jgi:hypothetical protein